MEKQKSNESNRAQVPLKIFLSINLIPYCGPTLSYLKCSLREAISTQVTEFFLSF